MIHFHQPKKPGGIHSPHNTNGGIHSPQKFVNSIASSEVQSLRSQQPNTPLPILNASCLITARDTSISKGLEKAAIKAVQITLPKNNYRFEDIEPLIPGGTAVETIAHIKQGGEFHNKHEIEAWSVMVERDKDQSELFSLWVRSFQNGNEALVFYMKQKINAQQLRNGGSFNLNDTTYIPHF